MQKKDKEKVTALLIDVEVMVRVEVVVYLRVIAMRGSLSLRESSMTSGLVISSMDPSIIDLKQEGNIIRTSYFCVWKHFVGSARISFFVHICNVFQNFHGDG